ncbi:MAG TPA: PP2C family protein-serine/threonine phosphatase [Solirubrobacteraceae bacterium]|nr:PP2C family protein-serine/threonine phosphatase [Solirubrobacteraceae bacterium]
MLVALLLVAAPATPTLASGKGRDDRGAGQAREGRDQATRSERRRPAEAAPAPVVPVAPVVDRLAADNGKSGKNAGRSRKASGAKVPRENSPGSSKDARGNAGGAPNDTAPDGSSSSARGNLAGSAAAQAQPQAQAAAAAQPASAQAAAATPPVAAVVPVVTPPPTQPAPAARPRVSTRARSTTSLTLSERGAGRTQRTSGAGVPTRVPAVRVADPPAAGSAAAAVARMEPTGGAAAPEEPKSPLTRTVTKVLEVIPAEVRLALAALALLGLLLGATTAVQTVRGRRLARQRKLLLADFGILQSAFLPELPERIGGARVTTAYRPAAGLAAGGDFYDAFELAGGRTGVIVGDVTGHGRDAIPLTALVRYNLRAYLEAGLTPRATLDVASSVLAPQLGGRQVTIVVAIFDPGTGRLTYACAGHWPPLLLGTTATLVTACSSPPIGAGLPTGRRQTTVALPPGAAACFATDGLADVPIGHGRRLERSGVAVEFEAVGANGDAAELVDRVVRRSERQPDDMAACILTALPGGAEHWSVQLEELEVDSAMLHGGHVEQFLVTCGAERPQIARALAEAQEMVSLAGTAIVEVRIGEQLLEVRVDQPPAVSLPIARRRMMADDLSATG